MSLWRRHLIQQLALELCLTLNNKFVRFFLPINCATLACHDCDVISTSSIATHRKAQLCNAILYRTESSSSCYQSLQSARIGSQTYTPVVINVFMAL